MADEEWEYYAAIIASTISTVAWIATVGAGAAAGYYAITSGPALQYARWTGIALLAAILFALVEKRLYRIDDER